MVKKSQRWLRNWGFRGSQFIGTLPKKNNSPAPFSNLFKLKKPCNNCPFLKAGGIELEEGRLEEIIASIENDDLTVFHCHKTVHNEKTGGEWSYEGDYTPSNQESLCVGSIIYLEKVKKPSVFMRIGRALGRYKPDTLKDSYDLVIDGKE